MSLFLRNKRPADDLDRTADLVVEAPRLSRTSNIGDLLRETRQSYSRSLDDMSAALRIRASHLAAIEESRYDRLPGQAYALGFVRAYALALGLDGDEAVRRFKQETAGNAAPQDLSFPAPLPERSIPGGRMVLMALVLAVCGYGLWYYLSTASRDHAVRVADVPAELMPPPAPPVVGAPAAAAPTAAPSAAPSSDAAPPPAATSAPAPAAPAPAAPPAVPAASATPPAPAALAPADTTAPGVPTAFAAPASAAAEPVPPPPPAANAAAQPAPSSTPASGKVYGEVSGPVHIVIRATADSWIQVRDRDDNLVSQRLLHAGDTYRVPDQPGLVMRTGNGSGLEIAVDGNPVPAIGGAVRHKVLLDPARLRAGTAAVD